MSDQKLQKKRARHKPKQQNNNKRVCLLVLGMHRSGTSAISGALNDEGISFGNNLLGPASDNVKGYFESRLIQAFHDKKLLPLLGRDWKTCFQLFAGNWLESPELLVLQHEARNIIVDEYAGLNIFAIKDPRMCHTLPFWLRVLDSLNIEVKVIYQYRHPQEVAASLHKRNGFTQAQGLALWVDHMLQAEFNSRNIERVFTTYDELLENPTGTIRDALLALDIKTNLHAKNNSTFIDKSLRNNNDRADAGEALFYDEAINALSFVNAPDKKPIFTALDSARQNLYALTSGAAEALALGKMHEAELFLDYGEGFSEANKLKAYYPSCAGKNEITFGLPTKLKPLRIRFDPLSSESVMQLYSAHLRVGETEIDITEQAKTNASYGSGGTFYFATKDPNLIFGDLSTIKAGDDVSVCFQIELIASKASALAVAASINLLKTHAAKIKSNALDIEQMCIDIRGCREDLNLCAENAQLRAEIAALQRDNADALEKNAHLADSASHAVAALNDNVGLLHSENAHLQAEIGLVRASAFRQLSALKSQLRFSLEKLASVEKSAAEKINLLNEESIELKLVAGKYSDLRKESSEQSLQFQRVLAELSAKLAEQRILGDGVLSGRDNEILKLGFEINQLQNSQRLLIAERDLLVDQSSKTLNEISKILTSRSWTITRPLRNVFRRFKRG